MGTPWGRVIAGGGAQILAQATAGWALLAHFLDWPNASVWVAAPLVAAIVVPFRHDGSFRDRAVGNFGASLVVSGLMWWELMIGGLDGVLGGAGFTFGAMAILLMISTTMFAFSGAMFWLLRREGRE